MSNRIISLILIFYYSATLFGEVNVQEEYLNGALYRAKRDYWEKERLVATSHEDGEGQTYYQIKFTMCLIKKEISLESDNESIS